MNNTCVCCGEIIPEGRMICGRCEKMIIKEEKIDYFKIKKGEERK